MNQKGISAIVIILIIVGVLIVAGGTWYFYKIATIRPLTGCDINAGQERLAKNIGTNECKGFSYCDNIPEGWTMVENCEDLVIDTADWQTYRNEDLVIDTADWQTYRNEEYGFELKFPKTWNGYKITEEKDRARENYDFQKYKEAAFLYFEYPQKISSKGNPGEVGFAIIIFDEKNWKLAQGIKEIGRDNLYIFGYYPSNAAAPDDLLDRYNEITQILSTFKFIQ